jgi:hypothetical protein
MRLTGIKEASAHQLGLDKGGTPHQTAAGDNTTSPLAAAVSQQRHCCCKCCVNCQRRIGPMSTANSTSAFAQRSKCTCCQKATTANVDR